MAFFNDDQKDVLDRYFAHTPEHPELISYLSQTLESFLANQIAPHAAENDEKEIFRADLFKELGELGFVSLSYPEKFGGMNMNWAYYIAALESAAKADAGFTLGVAIHGTTADGIYRFASDAIKERVLGDLLAVRKIGAFALSESDSGSDAQALRTRYRKDKGSGDYLLNGTKFWITNAISADYFFVMARSEENPKEISAFLVEQMKEPSFQINPIKYKMGVRGSNTGELIFENHRVPKANLIGKEGEGFRYAMHMLNGGRTTIGAWATGVAQGAFEKFLKYAHERKLFNQHLKDLDNTKCELSEMLIQIKGARELAYAAAYEKFIGHKNFPRNSAIAKIAGTEASVYVGQRVIELAGGYGYLTESKLERHLRDALLGRIGEGANEVLKIMVIPKFIFQHFEEKPLIKTW